VPKPATLNTAYSISIDMQLSAVGGGWQRIIGSAGYPPNPYRGASLVRNSEVAVS
jgi:hypothetical protein